MHVVFPGACQEYNDDKDGRAYVDEDKANGESGKVLGRYAVQDPMLYFIRKESKGKQVELND